MLTVHPADHYCVLHRALVLIAIACSALLVASFGMFARDQIAGAAKHQANEVNSASVNQTPASTPKPRAEPGRFIVGAASKLSSPFRSVVQSGSAWVQRGVPTILGLLVYGVGIGFLARFSRGFA